MHSASFFKTLNSDILPILKSSQIKVFWHLENVNQLQTIAIFQYDAARKGNTLKMEIRELFREQNSKFENENSKVSESVALGMLTLRPQRRGSARLLPGERGDLKDQLHCIRKAHLP